MQPLSYLVRMATTPSPSQWCGCHISIALYPGVVEGEKVWRVTQMSQGVVGLGFGLVGGGGVPFDIQIQIRREFPLEKRTRNRSTFGTDDVDVARRCG